MMSPTRAVAHRVAMVLPRLDVGGMEHTVLAQVTALRARAVDAQLVVLQAGGALATEAEARGIPVHAGVDLASARDATKFLEELGREQQWTHVHSHTGTWWAAARAASRLRIPHIHTRHGFVETYTWRAAVTEWLAARQTDAVIAVSAALCEHTRSRLGVRDDRCRLIRNGIANDAFDVGIREPAPTDPPALAMVCRLATVKNVPLAVQALAALRHAWPSLTLHIVGEGPEHEHIRATAHALRVHEAVHLHGASTEPWRHVPAGAIVIQSSDSEGLSLSLIEAMAHGHRVVATDVGETRAFCDGAAGARIVPAARVQAMVDAISALLHTPSDLAKQQGAANRVHARQHGSLSTVIDAVIYCYERLSGPA